MNQETTLSKSSSLDKDNVQVADADSLDNNDSFWNEQGKRLDWKKKYTKIKDVKYSSQDVKINWYYDGKLNVSENCIDRHAKLYPNKIAIIWEGDDPSVTQNITYKELLHQVCKTANALKKIGVKKLN